MKVRRAEASQERTVLLGMITNRAVLGAIASKWTTGFFSSRWGNLIGAWCVEHYRKYRKPPGKSIQTVFDAWAIEAKRDKETIQLVERFLGSLSSQYATLKKDINPEYVIDIANTYFTKVKLKELADAITATLDDGDIDGADALVKKYSKVEVDANLGVDILSDEEAMERMFEAKREPLIQYEHGLEIFYGEALERDGFIGLMGPEKRGKTWILMDLAWMAMEQGRKVAFFEVGDLSQNQIMRRFMTRATQLPVKPRSINYPLSLHIEEDDAEVIFEEREYKKGMNLVKARKACANILGTGDTQSLKLFTYPNSTISIYGVQSIIENLERQDWLPDVIVIDYADILAPPAGTVDSRDQINTTWKAMRAMSQQYHCLVVTATQAKASSYTVETMGMQDFSEDKRKFAHVTGMVGLNANNSEKDRGIMRFNWIVLREDEYTQSDCCWVAGCLPLASPCIHSFMEIR